MHWLQEAGDQAVRQVAFEEAIEHYRGALVALDLCPADPDRRYELLAGLAESAFIQSMDLSLLVVSASLVIAAAFVAVWAPGRDGQQLSFLRRLTS